MKQLMLLIVLATFSCKDQGKQTEPVTILSPATYKEAISSNDVQLVDVRTPEEFKEGHIGHAVNIDFFSEDFASEFEKFNKDQPLYIYCRSGNRSAKAAKKLHEMGFGEIYDLKGGILKYHQE